jgi:hypothetical protein
MGAIAVSHRFSGSYKHSHPRDLNPAGELFRLQLSLPHLLGWRVHRLPAILLRRWQAEEIAKTCSPCQSLFQTALPQARPEPTLRVIRKDAHGSTPGGLRPAKVRFVNESWYTWQPVNTSESKHKSGQRDESAGRFYVICFTSYMASRNFGKNSAECSWKRVVICASMAL